MTAATAGVRLRLVLPLPSRRMLGPIICIMSTTGLFLGGCDRKSAPPPPPAGVAAEGPPEFVDTTFDELYPIFLTRKLKPGPKAALWRDYYGRWVRWNGTLVSFTANGITIKQRLQRTVTFDVSLWLETAQRIDLRKRFKPGDHLSYIGRLDSYDDVFRTLYLVHGSILATTGPPHDGGP